MKKRMTVVSCVLAALMVASPLPVFAEDTSVVSAAGFTLKNEHFDFANKRSGLTLETDLADISAVNYMVIGIARNPDGSVRHYVLGAVNFGGGKYNVLRNSEGVDLKFGDLVHMYAICNEIYPGMLGIITEEMENPIYVVANAYDLFGDEFLPALRHEYRSRSVGTWDGPKDGDPDLFDPFPYEVVKGDANEDNEVNILDPIRMNKYILGVSRMEDYSRQATDMDNDGKITPDDSLGVLREVLAQ